ATPGAAPGLSIGREVPPVVARLHSGGIGFSIAAERAEAAATREAAAVPAVVDAVVTDLAPVDDAVPATGHADGVLTAELADCQLVRRVADVPLRLEHGDLVDLPDGEAEARGARSIQRDRAGRGTVHTPEIHGELPIDEDPHVVVADEVQ